MGLFDAVQAMGQAVFGAYFTPGLLHRLALDADGLVTQPPTFAAGAPIKVQVDSITAAERNAGVPDQTMRLLVLQGGISPAPTLDDEVTAAGVRYRIMAPIVSDPANIGWDLRGVPA
jgi:hypothetical protein